MIPWQSLKFRMSILYTIVLGLILAIVVGTIVFQVRRILYRNFDDKLKVKASEVGNMLNTLQRIEMLRHRYYVTDPFRASSAEQISNQTQQLLKRMWKSDAEALNLSKDYIQIYDQRGRIISQSENVTLPVTRILQDVKLIDASKVEYKNISLDEGNFRLIHYPFEGPNRMNYSIRLASSLEGIYRFVGELTVLSVSTIVVVLLLTSFLGWLLTKRVLDPVDRVVATAQKITHKDLHLRIEHQKADEEIQHLIDALNSMIERLEKSFEHVNDFSSHVAHELKTPLAIIRGEMELALQQPRDAEEYQRVMNSCLEEMDRLIRLVKDMLLLSRLDYRPEMFRFERMNIVSFLKELVSQMDIIFDQKHLELKMECPEGEIYVNGDPNHLRRLFLNLIDNAVKYTPNGGRVVISVSQNSRAAVSIQDSGRGIAPEHLGKIFEKFYRVKGSADQIPGSGLGLSIAQSIAKAHQGVIDVQSQPGEGTTFTVFLPLV